MSLIFPFGILLVLALGIYFLMKDSGKISFGGLMRLFFGVFCLYVMMAGAMDFMSAFTRSQVGPSSVGAGWGLFIGPTFFERNAQRAGFDSSAGFVWLCFSIEEIIGRKFSQIAKKAIGASPRSPVKFMQLKSLKQNGYSSLLRKVRETLVEGQRKVEEERVKTYWKTGRIIYTGILGHKDRGDYGSELTGRLAKDLNVAQSVLQRCVQFAKAYPALPKVAGRRLFSWSHYRELMTIPDQSKRSRIEKVAAQKGWTSEELAVRIKAAERRLSKSSDGVPGQREGVPQLKFTRGRLYTYRVVECTARTKKTTLRLDVGFKVRQPIKGFKVNDCLEITGSVFSRVTVESDELFTYQGELVKVIDADTLSVDLDTGLGFFIEQKLRLRGINCPEMDTEEGKRAKRFVESRLKDCEFIIVKTYKDRSDKFDRYLADIFFLTGEKDPSVVVREGMYLNQELLNERLAMEY